MQNLLTLTSETPEVHWLLGDDLCDCTFQRVGEWTNPYLAKTLRIRLCCIWKEWAKQYPEFVQEVDAFYDENRHSWERETREWDSDEVDMPVYLWYRQLAVETGKPLEQIRREYDMRKEERPKRITTKERKRRQDLARPTEAELVKGRLAKLKAAGWLL